MRCGADDRQALEQLCRYITRPNCGGQLKIIAAILDSAVIERILTHLGLQAPGAAADPGA